jgi:hypothetical protein
LSTYPGTIEIGSSGRVFTYEKITGDKIEGITITAENKLIKKGASLHGTSGTANGLTIESFGGQLAGGSGLESYLKMVAQINSAGQAGISLEKSGTTQPLSLTGSLLSLNRASKLPLDSTLNKASGRLPRSP